MAMQARDPTVNGLADLEMLALIRGLRRQAQQASRFASELVPLATALRREILDRLGR